MLLFVYGTLRSGFSNTFRQLMEDQTTSMGLATIRGKLYDLGNYPGLIVCAHPSDVVFGEVYQIHSDALIKELDLYENYRRNDSSSLFVRSVCQVEMQNGKSVDAIVYTYNKSIDNAIRIKEGDYCAYLSQR